MIFTSLPSIPDDHSYICDTCPHTPPCHWERDEQHDSGQTASPTLVRAVGNTRLRPATSRQIHCLHVSSPSSHDLERDAVIQGGELEARSGTGWNRASGEDFESGWMLLGNHGIGSFHCFRGCQFVGYQQHATAERWQEASGDGLVEWFFLHLLCVFPHLQLGRHNIDMEMITLSSSTNLFVLTLLYMSSCTQLVSW